jgi:hypothetical protein
MQVGGITLHEVHEMMQVVDQRAAAAAGAGQGGGAKPSARSVIMGGTSLLEAQEFSAHLFARQ